ncbi:hypothetical protein Tco_0486430 [Tanacetum coccineum]
MNYDNLAGHSIHPRDVVDWEFLSNKGLAQSFFSSINTDTFSGPQWVNLFKSTSPSSVCLFMNSLPRLSLMPLLLVNLYTKRESKDVVTLSGLRRAETVNFTHLTYLFWPSIGDNRFNVGNTKAKSIRDPRIKLAHQCIMMTITGRKKTTNHVAEIDLFYLYCIYVEGVVCNIPY